MKSEADGKADRVAREIAGLRELDAQCLRKKWEELYGTKAPRCARPSLMVRAIAYKLQENAFGGLKPSIRRLLQRGGEDAAARRPTVIRERQRISAGTVLLREWHGTSHQVTVREDGVHYRGKRYSSLSEVARLITGCRWSGPLFFGLKSADKESTRGAK